MIKRIFLLLYVLTLTNLSFSKTNENESKSFTIPSYFIAKAECYVLGSFDAIGSNTVILFENNRTESFRVTPIIESKNKILFTVPDTYGDFELIIVDEGTNSELFIPVKVVKLDLEYDVEDDKLNKPINFRLNLLGAEKMEEEFSIKVENKTPHVISIIDGNYQKHKIKSTAQSEEVFWEGKFVAFDHSNFLIRGFLDQPGPTKKVNPYDQ
ncbi:hypothetical protein ACUNWD_05245 [Sunxiuqinia sp. A32]|uniref:hypothetical protein n=1 Tax=Sunxiuqinia sp. A32 TaxID=3461496 RepID=UPI0040453063